MNYSTEEEIMETNRQTVQYAGEGMIQVLDPNRLNSIVEVPQQTLLGREAYPTAWLKTAYYLQKLTKKHVFADGNRRTVLETMRVFLLLNNINVKFYGIEAEQMVLDVTNSPDSEEIVLKVVRYLKNRQIRNKDE